MRSSLQKLNRNFHFPKVNPGDVERVGPLELSPNNLLTGTPNSTEGDLGITENPADDLVPPCIYH